MNQAELHELQHEGVAKEFDLVWDTFRIKDECDIDIVKRIELLENTQTMVTISRIIWWKEYLLLTAILLVGFLTAVACVDVGIVL